MAYQLGVSKVGRTFQLRIAHVRHRWNGGYVRPMDRMLLVALLVTRLGKPRLVR